MNEVAIAPESILEAKRAGRCAYCDVDLPQFREVGDFWVVRGFDEERNPIWVTYEGCLTDTWHEAWLFPEKADAEAAARENGGRDMQAISVRIVMTERGVPRLFGQDG